MEPPLGSRREMLAFCLAPVAAPAAFIMVEGPAAPYLIVTAVAYAALSLGYPLYRVFRLRAWPSAAACLVAGALSGAIAGVLLTAALLYAASPNRFVEALPEVAWLSSLGTLAGTGLGLVAGAALWVLLGPWTQSAPVR